MKVMIHGSAEWKRYRASLTRSASPRADVHKTVARILRDVRQGGDTALVRLTARFDRVRLTAHTLRVPAAELRAAARRADAQLVSALRAMARRIESYHRRQLERGFKVVLGQGSWLAEVVRPIDSVGLYVPGGAGAYPSSVLMNAIPARVAGVPRIAVVTPPKALDQNPALAAALAIVGLESCVYRVGGAQAVAALAYGTDTVQPVAKIFGPGNAYVAEAKRQVRGLVEIDQDAGPSEVVILADETADAGWVAVDLLAQAEHGTGDETVVLVTPSRALASEVARLVESGVAAAANPIATRRALARNGAIVLVKSREQGVKVVNDLAPEHVEIQARGAATLARGIVAGAIFVGNHTPVAVGDYGVGPNHVLPTGGAARVSSPLSVRDFMRRQSVVCLSEKGLRRIASDVVTVARAEGFRAHAESVLTRFEG
jgi:histidinol dehydrogenase